MRSAPRQDEGATTEIMEKKTHTEYIKGLLDDVNVQDSDGRFLTAIR